MHHRPLIFALAWLALAFSAASSLAADAPVATLPVIRIGIIGIDTSHAVAFSRVFHDPKAVEANPDLAGFRVVAAFPGGSQDIASSRDRIATHAKLLTDMGVEMVDSIPALLKKVDVILLESVDGRPHLEQARPVIEARKPLFIDKPLAGSLADAVAIAELAKRHDVPWFSSSALRYTPAVVALAGPENQKVGKVTGCAAFSPCSLEPHHPDLFWYGVHGVEILYTVMGSGCDTVQRTQTKDFELVTGTWADGRIGTFRGIRSGKSDYGATVFGSKAIVTTTGFGGYQPLVAEIARFFRSGKPPISPQHTLELFAFMAAADESKRQGGAPVKLETVLEAARKEAAGKIH